MMRQRSICITLSKLLHGCKVPGVACTLDDPKAVLDVAAEVLDPGVKNVPETVPAQVLETDDAVGLGEGALIQPQRLQLQD
jgi:hypothetical protein